MSPRRPKAARVHGAKGEKRMSARRIENVKAAFRHGRYRWWHAVAFGLAANIVSGAGTGRGVADKEFYEGMEQAPFAPPAWVFGPAWTINNVSVLWGNLRLLNLPEDTPHKRALLWLQGASWFLYSTFGYVYFRKKSTILAFVWTAAFWVLTVASLALSLKAGRKDIAASLGSLISWLTLATPVAAYQAARNPDELLGFDPRR